jgi:hypothetical protein
METLGGFPYLPAMVRAEQSSAAPHASELETLGGFPYLPAMVRAEQSSAAPHASELETLGGFPYPRLLPPSLRSALHDGKRRRVAAENREGKGVEGLVPSADSAGPAKLVGEGEGEARGVGRV